MRAMRRRSWPRRDACQPAGDRNSVGAARQVEDGAARRERLEPEAPSNREPNRLRDFELAARGTRHVAARSEDAGIEVPAVHADPKMGFSRKSRVRLFNDPA